MGNNVPNRNRRTSPLEASDVADSRPSLLVSSTSTESIFTSPRFYKKNADAKRLAGKGMRKTPNFGSAQDLAALARPPFAFRAVAMSPSDHSMIVNMNELRLLLTRPEVRNKPVVVLSVTGMLRRGKGFLLNFLMRYLETLDSSPKFLSKSSTKTWLNTESSFMANSAINPRKHHEYPKWEKEPGGSEASNSIYVWSKPYVRNVAGVGDVVVLLVDAQTSTFECPLTAKDCATVVAMSTMISSVQIFNIQGSLEESDLQHLHMFLEYGRNVLSDDRAKPFQNLVFLIRDWARPYEFPYGFEGGDRYLSELRGASSPASSLLSSSDGLSSSSASSFLGRRHVDLERIWQRIDDCFESVDCFLMPHPGTAVATCEKYTGPVKHIEPCFIDSMRQFVPRLLSENNLVLKKINNNPVTCDNLFNFLKNYGESLQANGLPTIPDSLVTSAAHLHYWSVFDAAKSSYEEQMEQFIDHTPSQITGEQLKAVHQRLTRDAAKLFTGGKSLFDDDDVQGLYIRRLTKFTSKRLEHYVRMVEAKNCGLSDGSEASRLMDSMLVECRHYLDSCSHYFTSILPAFVRHRAFIVRCINAFTFVAMACLCVAIISVIGLPVLVSVSVGATLYYFTKRS